MAPSPLEESLRLTFLHLPRCATCGAEAVNSVCLIHTFSTFQ
jgi:hypothetical protein